MTAAEKILRKSLVASGLNSKQWNGVQAGLRDRAFFSSRVESARFLHAAQNLTAQVAAGRMAESEVQRELTKVLMAEGRAAPTRAQVLGGSATDLMSKRRLGLVIKTNVDMARGWLRRKESMETGAIDAYPADELVRVGEREVPRDWVERWRRAGGKFFPGRRMIALKSDPVWTAISAFGHPWPPFDFNSGMGVRGVSREECEALKMELPGAIQDGEEARQAAEEGFNAGLQAEVPFEGKESGMWKFLNKAFGDQIKREPKPDGGAVIKWQNEFIRGMVDEAAPVQATRLGVPTTQAVEKAGELLPEANRAMMLTMTGSRVRHIWKRHGEGGEETRGRPLTREELDLIPLVWRNPDRVKREPPPETASKAAAEDAADGLQNIGVYFEMDMFDGTTMRLVLVPDATGNHFKTFYPVVEKKRANPVSVTRTAKRGI